MTVYISYITGYVNQFIYIFNYVGNHLSDYPGLITLITLMIVIFASQLFFKIFNE